jgi:hypothetical protein
MTAATSGQVKNFGFVRSAAVLIACIVALALVLMPFAIHQVGSGGIVGLLIAAAICLLSGLAAEGIHSVLARNWSPVAAQLVGMAIRMLLPLAICLILALQGFNGRQNLAFVCYLLAFYVATLALETWLAVKRIAGTTAAMRHSSR